MGLEADPSSLTRLLRIPSAGLITRLVADVPSLEPWLIETRRELHRHPELGWREIETTRYIVRELQELGFRVVSGRELLGDANRRGMSSDPIPGEGDTGCIASFDTGRAGPTVCLRVDIDALPIREAESGHRPAVGGFASRTQGVMHACGHDGHIAIGLGVARTLAPLLDSANGKLLILFQPAEEGGRGAQAVVDAGWMAGIDLLLAVHIGLGVPSNTVAVGVDGFLATRKFSVDLAGRSAHAGKSPENGRNALLAACQAALGLHGLAQSSEPGVRVNVGVMRAGTTLNVVPDQALLEFEIRAAEMAGLESLDRRCRTMVEMTAAAHEVNSTISLRGAAESWRNPAAVVSWAATVNSAVNAFGDCLLDHSFGASEDATVLANEVVRHGGAAGIIVLGSDLSDGHHTPHFDFDESVLSRGVLFASAAIGAALAIELSD